MATSVQQATLATEPVAADSLFDEAPQIEPKPASPWIDLPPAPTGGRYGEFPYNHAPVLLTPDGGQGVVAQWQTTRRWKGRWEPTGFWAERNTGGKEIKFEPLGYRRIQE